MTNLKTVQATLKGVNIDSFIVTSISKNEAIAFEKGQDFNAIEWKKVINDHYNAGVEFFTNESKDKVYGLLSGFISEISPYSTSIGGKGFFCLGVQDHHMLVSERV